MLELSGKKILFVWFFFFSKFRCFLDQFFIAMFRCLNSKSHGNAACDFLSAASHCPAALCRVLSLQRERPDHPAAVRTEERRQPQRCGT